MHLSRAVSLTQRLHRRPPLQAAVRGLEEELGIAVSRADLRGPLAPTHLRDLRLHGFHDRELVQSYLLPGWQGQQLRVDPAEVAGIRWITREDLVREVEAHPGNFTDWVRAEGRSLQWLQDLCNRKSVTTQQPTPEQDAPMTRCC